MVAIITIASFFAVRNAGCFLGGFPLAKAMSDSFNYILLYKNFATYGTVFAFGKTCCGTGGRNGFIDYFGVSISLNYILSD